MASRRFSVNGDHNIAGNNLNNVGNVMNLIFSPQGGPSGHSLTLDSKVAFGALLNSAERYPAPHCHPDTRVAAQKVVKGWIARKGYGSEKRIMWISGAPGVGKSAILQTVCETLTGDIELAFEDDEVSNDGVIDACHYFFGRGMGDREKALFFPATIAYQLVQSRASYGARIQKIVAQNPSILLESFPSQFHKLLIRPSRALAASETPVTVVIDALDECNNSYDQITLLNAILEAATTANMRFVIASRPEEHIQAFFKHANVSQHTYHIRLDGDFKASRDIEIFLRDKFAGIRERRPGLCPRLPNGEDWPGSLVIYRLRDDSDGQFIYPTLVIAFIDTPYFPPDRQLKSLLAAPPARAFSKLDALYHQILSRYPPELPAGSDEQLEYRELVMRILRVVVCWPEPLAIAGIAKVLGTEIDAVQTIIHGPMRSLFRFDSTNVDWAIIMLCHKSFRDYLLDSLRSQDFFLATAESPDTLYIDILSRRPPADPSPSYSREVLMGALRVVVALGSRLTVPQIAAWLGVTPSQVDSVIFGPAKMFFEVDISTSFFGEFLLDSSRAGEYFIPRDKPLDTLFIQILSREPPSALSQSTFSREVLMGALAVVVALGSQLTVPQIASLLNVAPGLVDGVIFGPAKVLFKLDGGRNIDFSTPLFKPFLLDASRAGEFFIPSSRLDALFIQILSHQPPSDPSPLYSREVLMRVLAVVVALGNHLKMPQMASLLYVAPGFVDGVIFGPAKVLFQVDGDQNIDFSTPLLQPFLLDASRAGDFFIPSSRLDYLFIQILSHQPPSDPSPPYSREVLMGVLAVVVALGSQLKVLQMACLLDIAPSLVEAVIFGPAKALFKLDGWKDVDFSTPLFKPFLLDASRAGEFLILSDKPEALFIQILSHQPPSAPSPSHSREVLMGALAVVVALGSQLTVPQIASLLDVVPGLVDGVIFGPAKGLFQVDGDQNVGFSTPLLQPFFLDTSRAGEFFIPRSRLDALFIQILSHPPPSDHPPPHPREALMGVLAMIVALDGQLKVHQIAFWLDSALWIVEWVIFGPFKALFELDAVENVVFSVYSFSNFLLDPGRAGEFFLSKDKLAAVLTRILSRKPSGPLYSYSRDALMSVLRTMAIYADPLAAPVIALYLGIDRAVVEGIFGLPLFCFPISRNTAKLLPNVRHFLADADCAGEFYIPPYHLCPNSESMIAKIEDCIHSIDEL